jgi:hypothetical protein
MDLGVLYVSLAAFGGAILSAVLGWLESREEFDPRKFVPSIIRAVGASIVFAIGYGVTGDLVTMSDVLIAVAAGVGVDAGFKRLAGTIRS